MASSFPGTNNEEDFNDWPITMGDGLLLCTRTSNVGIPSDPGCDDWNIRLLYEQSGETMKALKIVVVASLLFVWIGWRFLTAIPFVVAHMMGT
jgi:hypothetical protein